MTPNLDHPTLPLPRGRFPGKRFVATEFRGLTTVVTLPADLKEVLTFLKNDPGCGYDQLADLGGVDYLNYPGQAALPTDSIARGRFAVIYNLSNTRDNRRLLVKTLVDPSIDTRGIEEDPALQLPSCCDLWAGAEWMEREVYDMFGIRFTGHPDLRRILLWETYPAHPLRKDYPVTGRGERERYRIVDRESA